MAGIYVHIPFCLKKCTYCDFYKSTNLDFKARFIDSLLKEIKLGQNYLDGEKVETIYFGGGTPSVLSRSELELIFETLFQLFEVESGAEITFEANPDDLTPEYLSDLIKTPVNRLSIGIQSFSDENLQMMGRRHDKLQAAKCVEDAFNLGFENISIDLIYGLPSSSNKVWEISLQQAFALPIKHLSAYHITYHKHTHLGGLLHKGALKEISEDDSFAQFGILIETAAQHNFEHYEISNFAKEGKISKHNYGYWFGQKYLGLGPSAHSYNQTSRSWNISDLPYYIKGINSGGKISDSEHLSETDKFNDYIITRLRTKWGISEDFVRINFGDSYLDGLQKDAKKYIEGGSMVNNLGCLTLTRKGLFISDKIMEELIAPKP
jgi:oxygen-independent coproporphyrinogen III oxidase